uniref:Protein ARV n=1 Tax=Theileria annulata TaxID=5874 RepID=A0A3B0NEA0_THEAN
MIKCVNCGIEVITLYHIYNETNYCLSTCENCGQICDKYVEWEIPLIIIDLFLFKTQVYRHLIYNHSQFPSISPVTVLGPTDRVGPGTEDSSSSTEETSNSSTTGTVGASTVTKGKGANSTAMECTSEKNPNEIAAVTKTGESGTNTVGTKESPFGVRKSLRDYCWTRHRNGKIIRIILLLISATILDSYSMLTSCNYLTNTPNICFPQFQSYNQTLLNYIILYFKSYNTYINSQGINPLDRPR